jgi:hypothetical protein
MSQDRNIHYREGTRNHDQQSNAQAKAMKGGISQK